MSRATPTFSKSLFVVLRWILLFRRQRINILNALTVCSFYDIRWCSNVEIHNVTGAYLNLLYGIQYKITVAPLQIEDVMTFTDDIIKRPGSLIAKLYD